MSRQRIIDPVVARLIAAGMLPPQAVGVAHEIPWRPSEDGRYRVRVQIDNGWGTEEVSMTWNMEQAITAIITGDM